MGPKFLLLISSVSTNGFKIRDLQVRVLAKYIIFNGLHFAFIHLGSSIKLLGSLRTKSHLSGVKERQSRSCDVFWTEIFYNVS